MTENIKRRLPVGIQSFEEIRTKEYLYVDKTDIIWHLANEGNKFIGCPVRCSEKQMLKSPVKLLI